jgi:hypothetical protein
MSYSEWANFVYYDVGGIASYNGIVYQALLANVNVIPTSSLGVDWQLLPAPAGAGVSSLETLTGAITLSCSSGTYANVGNDIGLTIAFPVPPLTAINGLTGAPVIDTLARSTIEVQTISPNIQVGLNTTAFGTYTEATGGSSLTTITSAACVPSSIIQLTYIHASSVLTPNYLIGLTAGTGSFLVKTNANVDIGDQINWLVLNP